MEWSVEIDYSPIYTWSIPNQGGVYKVLRDDGEPGWLHRLYVGKTDNLRRRFSEHLADDENNLCLRTNLHSEVACYFKYAIINNEYDRRLAESRLLEEGSYEGNVIGQ